MFQNIVSDYKSKYGRIVLELGPGEIKQFEGYIGLDILQKSSVDYVCDLSLGFGFIEDDSIDEIYSSHFLEHIDNLPFFLKEINRILKKGGKMINVVPHFSNPYYYSDYTHKNFWGLYSICYFSKDSYFKRGVPQYYNDLDFKIVEIKLIFRSPFLKRNYLKKILTFTVNTSNYFKELYEEMFSSIFSCYEIYIVIEKK